MKMKTIEKGKQREERQKYEKWREIRMKKERNICKGNQRKKEQ